MNNKEYAGIVLQELTHTLSSIDEVQAENFVQLIDEADEVFCAGAGRSGFQVKGFAMRLMHMGVRPMSLGKRVHRISRKAAYWWYAAEAEKQNHLSTMPQKQRKWGHG